jgi:hypothetical protein
MVLLPPVVVFIMFFIMCLFILIESIHQGEVFMGIVGLFGLIFFWIIEFSFFIFLNKLLVLL